MNESRLIFNLAANNLSEKRTFSRVISTQRNTDKNTTNENSPWSRPICKERKRLNAKFPTKKMDLKSKRICAI